MSVPYEMLYQQIDAMTEIAESWSAVVVDAVTTSTAAAEEQAETWASLAVELGAQLWEVTRQRDALLDARMADEERVRSEILPFLDEAWAAGRHHGARDPTAPESSWGPACDKRALEIADRAAKQLAGKVT